MTYGECQIFFEKKSHFSLAAIIAHALHHWAGLRKVIDSFVVLGLLVFFGFVALLDCRSWPLGMQMELRMDASNREEREATYKTSHRIQAWFLSRSRKRWKQKHKELKVETKRLQHRVANVSKSREKWRQEAEQLSQRVRELEAQNAALQVRAAALKKCGPCIGPGLR